MGWLRTRGMNIYNLLAKRDWDLDIIPLWGCCYALPLIFKVERIIWVLSFQVVNLCSYICATYPELSHLTQDLKECCFTRHWRVNCQTLSPFWRVKTSCQAFIKYFFSLFLSFQSFFLSSFFYLNLSRKTMSHTTNNIFW